MKHISIFGLLLAAGDCMASQTLGSPLGLALGGELGKVLGVSLPVGFAGIAVLAGLGLVIGTQLIKRNKPDK